MNCAKMSERSGRLALYRREYRKLLQRVSQDLTREECRSLHFINSEYLGGQHGWRRSDGNLALFELLEKARVTSYDRPDRLMVVLQDIKRDDKCKEVELFIGTYEL